MRRLNHHSFPLHLYETFYSSCTTPTTANHQSRLSSSLIAIRNRNPRTQKTIQTWRNRVVSLAFPQQFKRRFMTTFSPSSSSSSSSTIQEDAHLLYLKQIQELEQERQQLFGDDNSPTQYNNSMTMMTATSRAHNFPPTTKDPNHSHPSSSFSSSSQKQILQGIHTDSKGEEEVVVVDEKRQTQEEFRLFKENLENRFHFTQEDYNAWTHYGNSNKKKEEENKVPDLILEEVDHDDDDSIKKQALLYSNHKENKKEENTPGTQSKFMTHNNITNKDNNNQRITLTHWDYTKEQVTMVDVTSKEVTLRHATAQTSILLPQEVMQVLIPHSEHSSSTPLKEIQGPKGPIFATARIAGIMAAKRTSELIPLCHPLPLEKIYIDIQLSGNKIIIECQCSVHHKTGVEMEALMGASISALTIYDMLKALSHHVIIENTKLVYKSGGKRDVLFTSL